MRGAKAAIWEALVIKSPICMERYGNYSATKHLITFTVFLMRAIFRNQSRAVIATHESIGAQEGKN